MADQSIVQENYQENDEIDYSQYGQYKTNLSLYEKRGDVLYQPAREIYEFIRNYCRDFVVNHPQYPKFKWKPVICDIGCGGGFGSNILSQEAEYVWGIDKDEKSIAWAQKVFTRHRNNIYFTPEMQFQVIDILNEDREIQAFDIITCIEVLEHIDDYQKAINFIKKLCKKDKKTGQYLEPHEATKIFISTPNRNYNKSQKDHPTTGKHVREWTPDELYKILTDNFKYVVIMNSKGELCELNMEENTMLFKCEVPR